MTKKKKVVLFILGGVGFLIVACVVLALLSPPAAEPTATAEKVSFAAEAVEPTDTPEKATEPSKTPKPTNTSAPTKTPRPTSTPRPTATATATPDPNVISPGTYLVGKDIQPGLYIGMTGTDIFSSCYWARYKDLSGGIDSMLANDNAIGKYYLEVVESDFAFETRCSLRRIQYAELPQAPMAVLPPGTYLVNIDLVPGLYQGKTGTDIMDSCYWARLKNLRDDMSSIIDNDNSVGQYYVQVGAGDYALKTACELKLAK